MTPNVPSELPPLIAQYDGHSSSSQFDLEIEPRVLTDAEYQRRCSESAQQEVAALAALPVRNLALEPAWKHVCRWGDSYSQLDIVVYLGDRMLFRDWLELLGRSWTGVDNVRQHLRELRQLLGTAGPLMPMMSPEEQAAYAALPNRITIYRGCSGAHLRGACWSLNVDVARQFPTTYRYRVPDPVLVTARVRKEHILAVKLNRGEEEVITFCARRVTVEIIK